jgi:hypothetical protein
MNLHLIVDKSVFCDKIKSQITSGKVLLEKNVCTENDLVLLRNDNKIWSAYNLELLKQSFNNSDNAYSSEYQKILKMGYLGTHTLTGDVKACKDNVQKRILVLESILNRIDLIAGS